MDIFNYPQLTIKRDGDGVSVSFYIKYLIKGHQMSATGGVVYILLKTLHDVIILYSKECLLIYNGYDFNPLEYGIIMKPDPFFIDFWANKLNKRLKFFIKKKGIYENIMTYNRPKTNVKNFPPRMYYNPSVFLYFPISDRKMCLFTITGYNIIKNHIPTIKYLRDCMLHSFYSRNYMVTFADKYQNFYLMSYISIKGEIEEMSENMYNKICKKK